MSSQPLSFREIEWGSRPDLQWPVPHSDWRGPRGYGEGPVDSVPEYAVEDALSTARKWYPRAAGGDRDACLLMFTDFFERYLAGILERQVGSERNTTTEDQTDHEQTALDGQWD
jgi:hypothetical protein